MSGAADGEDVGDPDVGRMAAAVARRLVLFRQVGGERFVGTFAILSYQAER